MRESKHDDVNLAEVKAVLGRLQQISRTSHPAGAQAARDDTADAALPQSPQTVESLRVDAGGVSDAVGIASFTRQVKAARPLTIVVLVVPVLASIAAIATFFSHDPRMAPVNQPSPPPVAAPPNPARAVEAKSPAAPLHVASELVASGQVRAARDVLLRARPEESADVAWALARSYDPNFLLTTQAADAPPDVVEATRWYRRWYEIAVRQGLVADSVSLDRIIKSMSEFNNR